MAVTFDTAKIHLAPTSAVSSMANQQYRPNLLDVPISFFEPDQQRGNFANVPAQQTTLRRIVSTKFYCPPVEAIRAEPDPAKQAELKKQLPAITPVALLHHRKKDTPFAERIRQQWPLIMGDIDRKENPGVDMTELKTQLARLLYVLLCGYSVRGGLWFVVCLPDHQTPESLAAHFRYLQKLFSKKFGITLDKGKGGNPTDLRFVSYDATPFIREDATVMAGTYTPKPPRPAPAYRADQSRYSGRDEGQLLPRLVRFAQTAGEGQRHSTLLRAAKLAGGFVAAGRMDEQTAVYALETVASEWPTFSKSQRTIRDGIRYGLAKPVYPDAPPARQNQPATAKPRPLIVRTLAEWAANPGSICRPEESQLERLTIEPCHTYPAEWD